MIASHLNRIKATVLKLGTENIEPQDILIVAPGWWLQQVKAYCDQSHTDLMPVEIHGATVRLDDDVAAPTLIAPDGRVWHVLDEHERATNAPAH